MNQTTTLTINSTLASWQNKMDKVQTPSLGCFYSRYPSLSWSIEPCSAPANVTENVGGGALDYGTKVNSGYLTDATGEFTSESNFGSEISSGGLANIYSLQLNTNNFSITFNHNPTQAWEQFVFYTPNGFSLTDYVLVEYWLLNYGHNYGCPPSPWVTLGPNCLLNSPETSTNGYYYPADLTQQSVYGSASSSGDTATFCSGTTCFSSTDSDFVKLSNSKWTSFEFNVFGYGKGAGALFASPNNVGFVGLTVNTLEDPNIGSACQNNVLLTGEYNNFNLAPFSDCSPTSQGISFEEATGYWLQMNAAPGGTVSPSSGWQKESSQVQISASYSCPAGKSGYLFGGWTGSGSGSYTGTNNDATITMNGAITETTQSTFYRVCPPIKQ